MREGVSSKVPRGAAADPRFNSNHPDFACRALRSTHRAAGEQARRRGFAFSPAPVFSIFPVSKMKVHRMSFRVAVLEFNQETNTFSKLKTGFRDFEACHYFVGAEIETHCRGTNSEIGGFIDCCDTYGWQPVYTVAARAEPGGRIEEAMRQRFVADLQSALDGERLDGVFIVFHGA
ncbi:MAG: M81 family metallopeptidase, partial [Ensifer adhaerens]